MGSEAQRLRVELNNKLLKIYSADPLPFPQTFDNFRRMVVESFRTGFKIAP